MNESNPRDSRALPSGTVLLHNYIIERVLGEGGFGITYACVRRDTRERFAVKEYFPNNIAYRQTEGHRQMVVPYGKKQELFAREQRHFLKEASMLSEFAHLEHIVGVIDILQTNGTVYLVMEFVDGITLKQYIEENEPLPFDELCPLFTPLMRDLADIHKRGVLHRDISPDNLILGTDNRLHLIDFGSADFESDAKQEVKTVLLKSGFAPPEQYLEDGKLGAWTDVYGLCATMYYALTGFAPTASIRRLQSDTLPSLCAHAQIRSWQANVIEKGLCLHAAERYQNMESLYQALIIPPLAVSSERGANIRRSMKNETTVIPASTAQGRTLANGRRRLATIKQFARYAVGIAFAIALIYVVLAVNGVAVPHWTTQETTATKTTEQDASGNSATKMTTELGERARSSETAPSRSSTQSPATTQSATTAGNTTEQTTQAVKQSKDTQQSKQKQNTQTSENKSNKSNNTKTATTESKDAFIALPEDDAYDSFSD